MTLSFKTKIDGTPTYFVEKILNSLISRNTPKLDIAYIDYCMNHTLANRFGLMGEKIHTIRADNKNRWRTGQNIHFVINNRTKNRFQFAPLLPVKFIQAIDIFAETRQVYVGLNGTMNLLSSEGVETLAKNDGFDSVDSFFKYFNEDFSGKIIHWTDFIYC